MFTPRTRSGDLVGYARVSTADQSLDLQVDALTKAGCVRIFTDVASGSRSDRPELANALDHLRPGDTLCVWKVDRLGRSTTHLVSLMNDLNNAGFGFRSITENLDTTSPMGEFIYTVFAALAQLERSMIQERTRAGLAAARERGAQPGRKPSLSHAQVEACQTFHASGKYSVSELAQEFKVSRATVYRALGPVA